MRPNIDYYNMFEEGPLYDSGYQYSYEKDFFFKHVLLEPCRRIDVDDYKFWCTVSGVTNDSFSGRPRSEKSMKRELYLANHVVYNIDKVGMEVKGSQLPDLSRPFFFSKEYKFEEDYPDLYEEGYEGNGFRPIGNDYYQLRRKVPSERRCENPTLRADSKDNGQFFNNGFITSNLEVVAFYKGDTHIGYGLAGGSQGNADPTGAGGGTFMSSGYIASGFYSQIWTGGYTNNSSNYYTKTIPNPEGNTLPDITVPDYTRPRGEVNEGRFRLGTEFGNVYMVRTIFIQNLNPAIIWDWEETISTVETYVELGGVNFSMKLTSGLFTYYKRMDGRPD